VHLVLRKQHSSSASASTSTSTSKSYGTLDCTSGSATTPNSNAQNVTIDIENQENEPLNVANINDNNNNLNNLNNDNNNNNRHNEIDRHDVDIMDVARMCRLIRLFAIVDCILMILFAFWGSLLFLCGVPLAICGYIGARNLKRAPLFLYGIFILLSIAFRIYLAYIFPTWLMILLTVVSVLLELYVFRQTIFVFNIIPQLTNNDRTIFNGLSSLFF